MAVKTKRNRRAEIEALELRRMLTFTVSGTAGHDLVEVLTGSGGSDYNIFVNGNLAGSTTDDNIVIQGLGGNDLLDVPSMRLGDHVELRGGAGNDTYDLGNGTIFNGFNGQITITELPGEGTDVVAFNNTQHTLATTLTIKQTSISSVSFPSNTEVTMINLGGGSDSVLIETVPNGMFLDLGNGNNTLRYGGSNHVLENSPAPGSVEGGTGIDTVIFDDTGANGESHHDYTITNAKVENQILTGIENLDLRIREHFNTGFPDNTITMTGLANVTDTITLRDTPGPTGVGGKLFIGTEQSPLDFDDLSVQINVIMDHGYDPELHDEDVNGTGSTWLIHVGSNHQQIVKGSGTVTFFDSDFIDINAGGTADHFSVGGLLPGVVMSVNSGGGNDTLETNNFNGHDNDLDEVFGASSFAHFSFFGGTGFDTMDLNDSADQTGDGDADYWLFDFGGETLRKGTNSFVIDYGAVEQLSLVMDSDNNTVHSLQHFVFGVIHEENRIINGGPGNDAFTNIDPNQNTGLLGRNRIDHTFIGGSGTDRLDVDDRASSSTISAYDLGLSSLSYSGASTDGTIAFDSTLESMSLVQNASGTVTNFNAKRSGLFVSVNLGDGNDTLVVGGGDLDSTGVMFPGLVTLAGGAGNDNVTFDDRLDNQSDGTTSNYTFGNLTLAKGAATITYSAMESQTLLSANGVVVGQLNTIPASTINAINSAITNTTIIGGLSRLAIAHVGSGDLSTIGSATSAITLQNMFIVNINDQNAGGIVNAYQVSDTQVFRNNDSGNSKTINYLNVQQLNLNTSGIFDVLAITRTPAGTTLTVNLNAGNDQVNLADGNVSAELLGQVVLNGGAGTDTLTIPNTFDNTLATQTLAATTFTDGLTHTYSAFEQLTLNEGPGGTNLAVNSISIPTTINGGNGNDTFTVGGGDIDANFPSGTAIAWRINGGNGVDQIILNDLNDTNVDAYIFERPSGADQFRKQDASIDYFVKWGGIESVRLDASNAPTPGGPLSGIIVSDFATPLRINGNAGNDTVQIFDASAPVTVHTGLGDKDQLFVNFDFDAVPVTVIMDQSDDVDRLSVYGPGGTLRITSGAVLTKTPTNSFQITGVLDLAGGSLLSRAGGPIPATLRTWITTGRNGGAWNGTSASGAINSSLAASSSLPDAIGYAQGSEIPMSTIGPFSIAAGDTLLRYTYYGDADLNGVVDFDDYSRTDAGFNNNRTGWVNGDYDYNNIIDFDDYSLIDLAFNRQVGTLRESSS